MPKDDRCLVDLLRRRALNARRHAIRLTATRSNFIENLRKIRETDNLNESSRTCIPNSQVLVALKADIITADFTLQ